jgi:hypothetical protein
MTTLMNLTGSNALIERLARMQAMAIQSTTPAIRALTFALPQLAAAASP